jgi:hypothetical protein
MFAALNTVEPPILELGTARLLEHDKTWHDERLPLVEGRVRDRLEQLSIRLGDTRWLDGEFSLGDLMMVSMLLRLKSSGILDEYSNVAAYVAHGEARPAYKRAFDAQLGFTPAGNRFAERALKLVTRAISHAQDAYHALREQRLKRLEEPEPAITVDFEIKNQKHSVRFAELLESLPGETRFAAAERIK